MKINIKKLTNYQLQEISKTQRIITETAAIKYECYVEKIDEEQFWDKWVWSKL